MSTEDRPDNSPTTSAPSAAPAKESTTGLSHSWNEPKPKHGGYHWGTGRRKRAIARVRIKLGTGQFKINGKTLDEYFRLSVDQNTALAALKATDTLKRVDVFVNAHGGGTTGQSGAVMLGVARALISASSEYLPMLRDGHYLTRDPRKVERKKYGRRGARRSFQFSKR